MKFLCVKSCCFCCLVFAYFCFVSWFLLVVCFAKIFLKKIWVCLDNLIYYTTDVYSPQHLTPPLPPPPLLLWRIIFYQIYYRFFNLNLLIFICMHYSHLPKSIFICVHLFLPIRIYFHLSRSLFICENLLEFLLFCENLFE